MLIFIPIESLVQLIRLSRFNRSYKFNKRHVMKTNFFFRELFLTLLLIQGFFLSGCHWISGSIQSVSESLSSSTVDCSLNPPFVGDGTIGSPYQIVCPSHFKSIGETPSLWSSLALPPLGVFWVMLKTM